VTVRAIGKRAGVDAAMVNHWYHGKEGLFAAAAYISVDSGLADDVVTGSRQRAGEGLLRAFLSVYERNPVQLAILVRNMHTNKLAANTIRKLVEQAILEPVVGALDVDKPDLRVALCGSQLIGLAVALFTTPKSALVRIEHDELIGMVGPNLQRFLDDPIRL
jgi:AcrR family transcriptional regulator